MGRTYSMRFRLRPSSEALPRGAMLADEMFRILDAIGVVDDVSDPGSDGTYAVWLHIEAERPEAAVGTAIAHLDQAQRTTRPFAPPDELVSIEVLIGGATDLEGKALSAL